MAELILTAPDGKRFRITGPSRDGAIGKARELADAMKAQDEIDVRKAAEIVRGQALAQTPVVPALEGGRPQQAGPGASALEAGSRQASESLLGNALGVARKGADLLGIAQAVNPASLVARLGGVDLPAPVSGRNVPTGEQAVAGVDVASQLPGAVARGQPLNVSERFARSMAAGERAEEQHPTASLVGGLAGDAATLATGRVPLRRGITALEKRIATPKTVDLAPSAKRAVDRVVNSKGFRRLARGAGRSVEAGAEGAFLASLAENGNEMETAAWTAGSQAVGSTMLEVSKGVVSGGPVKAGAKLALAGAATGALFQIGKTVTPGGDDRVLESLESGFSKVALSLAAGGVFAAAGAGRMRSTRIGEDLPRLSDALQTVLQRGPVIAAIKDMTADERVQPVLDKAAEDQGYFSERQKRRLLQGYENKRLGETIERMADTDTDFATRLEALTREVAELPGAMF